MADPSASQTAIADKAKRSDLDLEKGYDLNQSDFEAATIVPESEPATRDGPAGDEKAAVESEEDGDPNTVSWDSPDDPTNPMNWTMRKKWSNVAVLSILTIIT
jgi:hypothetical protein